MWARIFIAGKPVADMIQQLLVLQDRDRRATQLERERRDIPAHKDEIESRLHEHQETLRGAVEDFKKHELKIKEIEGDIEAEHQKIAKYKDQQLSVKNNDEYRALGREIGTTEKQVRTLEDGELVLMEEMEQLRIEVDRRRGDLTEEERTVSEDLAAMDKRLTAISEEIAGLESGRTGLLTDIDPTWLARYERIFQHLGDYAIVGVENGSCGGCHMRLPPQLVHDARKGDALTICTYCGRILQGVG